MFFRDLRPKSGATLNVTLAEVHLPIRLGHRDAEKIFAEPLKAQLAATGRGVVMDCRPREKTPGEISGIDLHLGLTDATRDGLRWVARMLDHLAAPCGSSIRLSDGLDDPLLFGVTEGLELSVGIEVAPDADARRDLATVCREAIEAISVSRGWAERDGRTLFYFYGESFLDMQHRLARALTGHPRFGSAITRRMA